jgi:hypothetical protein
MVAVCTPPTGAGKVAVTAVTCEPAIKSLIRLLEQWSAYLLMVTVDSAGLLAAGPVGVIPPGLEKPVESVAAVNVQVPEGPLTVTEIDCAWAVTDAMTATKSEKRIVFIGVFSFPSMSRL